MGTCEVHALPTQVCRVHGENVAPIRRPLHHRMLDQVTNAAFHPDFGPTPLFLLDKLLPVNPSFTMIAIDRSILLKEEVGK